MFCAFEYFNACELMTWKLAKFVLKIAHLTISMESRGPGACGHVHQLWLLAETFIWPSAQINWVIEASET